MNSLGELRLITVFCSLLAAGMGALYLALRIGFGADVAAVFKVVGLALFLVNIPLHWSAFPDRSNVERSWIGSPATGGFIGLLVTALLGWLPFAGSIGFVLSIAGVLLFAATVMREPGGADRLRARVGFVIVLLLAIAWCGGVSWGAGFANPLYLENVAMHGRPGSMSIDIFFHSAIANMISMFNVPSTGIDGVVPIQYHFGSHWLFAKWCALVGLRPIDFYQIGYPTILPALWFTAIATLILEIRRFRGVAAANLISRGVVLAILCAAVVGSLPYPATAALGFGLGPFFSESYGTTLMVGFFLAGIVFAHLAAVRSGNSSKSQELTLAVLVVPFGVGILAVLKASTFLLTVPALFYAILRSRLYRRPAWILCALVTAAVILAVMPAVLARNRLAFAPFGYLRFQLPLKWWPFFLPLHFFWTWVYAMMRFRQEGVTNYATLRTALGARSILDVEILTLTALGCMLPGLLLPLPYEAVYFTDQIRWLSVALILGDVWLLARLSGRLEAFRSRGFFGFAPAQVIMFFVGLPLVISFATTLLGWPISMVRMNLMTRKELSYLTGAPTMTLRQRAKAGKLFELGDGEMLEKGLANAPATPVIDALRSLSLLPVEERRHTALYVPASVRAYWNLYQSNENCAWSGFAAPGLAGVQTIEGYPPQECPAPRSHDYGLDAYESRASQPRVRMIPDSELCDRARKGAVTKVLVLQPVDNPLSTTEWPRKFGFRSVSCAGTTG